MRPSPDSSIPPTSRAWSLPPHCPPPPSDGRIYILLPRTVSRTHLVYCPHHIAAPKAYRTVSPSKQPSRICARRQIEVVRTYIPNIKWNGTPLHGLADNPRGDSRTRTHNTPSLRSIYGNRVHGSRGTRVQQHTHSMATRSFKRRRRIYRSTVLCSSVARSATTYRSCVRPSPARPRRKEPTPPLCIIMVTTWLMYKDLEAYSASRTSERRLYTYTIGIAAVPHRMLV